MASSKCSPLILQVSGGFLLAYIDRAISADMRRRFSAIALPRYLQPLGYK